MRSLDTSPEAHEVQMQALRSMSVSDRLALALQSSEEVAGLVADGVRSRHPEYDDEQFGWALRRLRLGDEVFRRVWPTGPFLAP